MYWMLNEQTGELECVNAVQASERACRGGSRYISHEHVKAFGRLCRGWNGWVIREQLKMVLRGERGIALHDNCIILLDGLGPN